MEPGHSQPLGSGSPSPVDVDVEEKIEELSKRVSDTKRNNILPQDRF